MEEKKTTIAIAVLISLMLHLFLVGLAYLCPDCTTREHLREEIIEIDLREGKEWKIADILPPQEEKRPKEAKHLGLHDSSVEEETVADGAERAVGRPVRRGGTGMEDIKKEVEDSFDKGEMREVIKLPKERPEIRGGIRMPEDFYPDYKRGPHTYINVMKHQDVAYFVRLKRVFKLAWDPTHVLMRHRMAGEVSRGRIRVVLALSIDRSGNIDELFVINSSSLKGYDAEAMRAVKASAPFSAPPKRFLGKDGILRISWSFVVYM